MSAYCSLPRVKLNKKSEVKKLNNFSNVYSKLFYKERANDVDVDLFTFSCCAKNCCAE